jgi:hypothetical protein
MSELDVLEQRLREAFSRRAGATTVHPPRHDAEVARLLEKPQTRRAGWLLVAAAALMIFAVVGGLIVARGGHNRRPDVEVANPSVDTLIEYQATALPEGYRQVGPQQAQIIDPPGDPRQAPPPAAPFGTTCLAWRADGDSVTCESFSPGQRVYARPDGELGFVVATYLGVDVDLPDDFAEGGERRAVEVQDRPATLRPATVDSGPRLHWEPRDGIVVEIYSLDPSLSEDQLLAIADGLRPAEVPTPPDMPYVVASLDMRSAGLADRFVAETAHLIARPAPDACLGMILVQPCVVEDGSPLQLLRGNGSEPIIAGRVSSDVERVELEFADGPPRELDLVHPGPPFEDEGFFVGAAAEVPTAVVAYGSDGSELDRHRLVAS